MKKLLAVALFAASLLPVAASVSSAGTPTAASDSPIPAGAVAAKCHRYANSAWVTC
jgi:hypothetical protein